MSHIQPLTAGVTPSVIDDEYMQMLLARRGLTADAALRYAPEPKTPEAQLTTSTTDITLRYAQETRTLGPQPIEPQLVALKVRVPNDDFWVVIGRVVELLRDDEDDPDHTKPTSFALFSTLAILFDACALLGGPFPRASADTDERGGISLYWTRPRRSVQLTVSAERHGTSFVYHREGKASVLDKGATARKLATQLRWFSEK